MTEITSIDVEGDDYGSLYRVTLYHGGRADVFRWKETRSGRRYLSTIKPGSQNHKRIMKILRTLAQPGSQMAEQIADYDA